MRTAPKASEVDRLVVDDLAYELIVREEQLVALKGRYDGLLDLVVACFGDMRQKAAQIAMLRRTVAELRGMPLD